MKRYVILCVCLCWAAQLTARTIGEIHVSAGGIYPQGNYVRYADPGFTGNLRFTAHVRGFGSTSGWVDLNGSFFSSDNSYVEVYDDPYISGADQRVSEYAFSLHAGLQLGAATRRGFFRPRAGVAPGLYIFDTETVLTVPGMDEPLSEENNSQVKFGWRGILGADLFFTPKWGVSLDITYDHVLNLDHAFVYQQPRGVIRVGKTARYHSYMVGIVIPFSSFGE